MKIFGWELGGKIDLKSIPDTDLPEVKVCVYTLCYNEEVILPFFLRHYLEFCDEVVVYNNGSTDNSVKIINSFKNTRVVNYHAGEIRDDLHMLMKNNIWKEARGRFDFVIVVDTDEFLYSPDMKKLLAYCKKNGKTVMKPVGYNMVSEKQPDGDGQIYEYSKNGSKHWHFNKCVLFDPNKIKEINYAIGAHKAVPRGIVRRFSHPDLKLLHYKFLSRKYFLEKMSNVRLSKNNIKNNWGYTDKFNEAELKKRFDDLLANAKRVI